MLSLPSNHKLTLVGIRVDELGVMRIDATITVGIRRKKRGGHLSTAAPDVLRDFSSRT